ncbi:sodium:solute symporter [Providencia manganoxydans]|uniref:Sodium:solute symporter n=1 Tax=Providencia manganoxydans TaxID=2923283 RepID=A0ABX7AL06_9GAMM|nr:MULTISPECIES: sodium:solute symporter [Providencia]ELR5042231.1 sodium:solute symporter [Providencia stuartii]ELR5080902.1 sodium:solute symporter [Providencia stuartii]MDX4945260.1 sodium:solute symporter [Providencia manganoxydans]QQO63884.1 sodium:solute symporter [Providencia manganoxydans]HEF8772277.1 sodium:solute symporter [Providencia stuartii]
MSSALVVITLFFLFSIYLALRAKKGKTMDHEGWSVGGRSYGALLVFLLSAGEIYTTFTFLGGSGWAYGKGPAILYTLAVNAFMGIFLYWVHPRVWRFAKENDIRTISDFFGAKYHSQGLALLVSLISIAAMVPLFVLQLKGLGIIVSQASYGAIPADMAIWIGIIAVTLFVMISGIHGSAWTSALKDLMILLVVLFIGIYIPLHYYGSFGDMFRAIDTASPGFLTFSEKGLNIPWYISTIFLSVVAYFCWPHYMAAVFTAKNEKSLKRNSILIPAYSLIMLFAFFVGYAAILQIPHLDGSQVDLSLFEISKATFSPVIVGLIGAAGMLTALVPGSMLLLTTSNMLAGVVQKALNVSEEKRQSGIYARFMVPLVALVSLYFIFHSNDTLVAIMLLGVNIVAQFFPALLMSFRKYNPMSAAGAIAGIIAGVLFLAITYIEHISLSQLFPWLSEGLEFMNIGIAAFILNILVATIVSLFTVKK